MVEYKSGTPLIPVDNERIGNAVYIRREGTDHIIVTDFGNEVKCDEDDFHLMFEIPHWFIQSIYENHFIVDEIHDLKRRWKKQIELLEIQLERL